MNIILLSGRVHLLTKCKDGSTLLVLKVKRPFKNIDGEYEYDYFNIHLSSWFTNLEESLVVGKFISIQGRLVSVNGGNSAIYAEKIVMMEGGE